MDQHYSALSDILEKKIGKLVKELLHSQQKLGNKNYVAKAPNDVVTAEQEKLAKERAAARKSMVSTGDRSAKIRTYNFPQGRITDHRINFTSYNLDAVMDGDIKEIIENLKIANQEEQLASFANN